MQVDLYREIKFRNSKQTFRGIPIIASNMDTVGTFEMASTFSKVIEQQPYLQLLFYTLSVPYCYVQPILARAIHHDSQTLPS